MRRNIMKKRQAILQRRYAEVCNENNRLKKELAEAEEFIGGLKLYVPNNANNN